MTIDELINDALVPEKEDYPYFNQEVHDFLLRNGWEFWDIGELSFRYINQMTGHLIEFVDDGVEVSEWESHRRDWVLIACFTNPIKTVHLKTLLFVYLGPEI